jgi:hypothetical protein
MLSKTKYNTIIEEEKQKKEERKSCLPEILRAAKPKPSEFGFLAPKLLVIWLATALFPAFFLMFLRVSDYTLLFDVVIIFSGMVPPQSVRQGHKNAKVTSFKPAAMSFWADLIF